MKRVIIIFLFVGLILHISNVAVAQHEDEKNLQEKIGFLENQLNAKKSDRAVLNQKSDSLALLVHELKTEESLNIFQRQRLEKLLMISQMIDLELTELDRDMAESKKQFQLLLEEIVDWYDKQIEDILKESKTNTQDSDNYKDKYKQLKELKEERDKYSKKLKPQSVNLTAGTDVNINEFDNYERIIQKADLLKDQEDKIRNQGQFVNQQVNDLHKEMKLRSRMNELIADTYLMDYHSEKPLVSAQLKGAKEIDNTYIKTDERESSLSAASPVNATDMLILQTDVSKISNLDMEVYIQRLKQLEIQLIKSADSLGAKAKQFYEAAEQRRREQDK